MRGETLDIGGPPSPQSHSRSLTRCHTISQDLTQRSLHTPSADPQLNGDPALATDLEEEAQSGGSRVETAGTEMDSVVL